jgi:hypothetical protein
MTEQGRHIADLFSRGFEIADETGFDHAQTLRGQHAPRHRAIVRADDDEIRLEQDRRLGLPVSLPERPRLVGHDRQPGIGRVGRQAGNLLRIGQRHHELVGAQVERDHPLRGGISPCHHRPQDYAQRQQRPCSGSAHHATMSGSGFNHSCKR